MTVQNFREVRILDNFYQTSSFFPMPVILVCTVSEKGMMNLAPYSLCFPYNVAGDRYQMVFNCRDNSNTGINLRRSGLCTLNFIPDNRKFMRNCVMLGYPGETTEEKMKNSIFTLKPWGEGNIPAGSANPRPDIVEEAVQVFRCAVESYDADNETHAMRTILNVQSVLLKERWHNSLMHGKRDFPRLPIDYGFRNNTHFWFSRHSVPYREAIPDSKATSVDSVMWAISRGGYAVDLDWDEEAAAKLVAVPRVFLNVVLKGIVEEAEKAGVSEITSEFLEKVRDKRSKDNRA